MNGHPAARGWTYAIGLVIALIGLGVEALNLGRIEDGILTLHPIDLKELGAWAAVTLSNGIALRAWWRGWVGRQK